MEKEHTIGSMVASNLNIASIFEKHGIDYCCNGNLSLQEACKKYKVNFEKLKIELETCKDKIHPVSVDIEQLSLSELIEHIVDTHHLFLKNAIPQAELHLAKIVSVHGGNHPELKQILNLFADLKNDILLHLKKEEEVLYPEIKKLESSKKINPGNSLSKIIDEIESEHKIVGSIADTIREITNRYSVPDDGCNTFKITYNELKEIEHDLHIHIVKENQILHPKALLLEKSLI